MVSFTEKSPNLVKSAKELLVVADKYQLETLEWKCKVTLCSDLTTGNCIEMIIFGDMYEASKLRTNALQFASRSVKKLKTSEWTKSLAAHPSLLGEVVEAMLGQGQTDDDEAATEGKYKTATQK